MSDWLGMEEFVRQLSDFSLGGRAPGTDAHERARHQFTEAFGALGLEPLLGNTWEQTYQAMDGNTGRNLLAVKRGKSDKFILIGAHYDHFEFSPGANDNAAAVGEIFEAIHNLTNDLDANLLIAIFDMEEPPYFHKENSMGSAYFYNNCPWPWENMMCAVILDLTGREVKVRGREDSLFTLFSEDHLYLSSFIKQATQIEDNLKTYRFLNRRTIAHLSDHWVYDINHLPNIFLSTGMYREYHNYDPELLDTFDKLDLPFMKKVSAYVRCLILMIDEQGCKTVNFPSEEENQELERFLNQELPVDDYTLTTKVLDLMEKLPQRLSLA